MTTQPPQMASVIQAMLQPGCFVFSDSSLFQGRFQPLPCQAHSFRPPKDLADRQQDQFLQVQDRPLGGWIKFSKGFDLIPEKLHSNRPAVKRGEDIHDPAAHTKISLSFNQRGP